MFLAKFQLPGPVTSLDINAYLTAFYEGVHRLTILLIRFSFSVCAYSYSCFTSHL
jgi:hypothetical protein